jgi:predicted ArsR family transcriptional regulator
MPQKISSRQHEILTQLLEHRKGLSVDSLATALDISRTAIQQHFVLLESDGYIKKIMVNKTAGRPVALYGITDKGINYFPKQYAWFAELIVSDLQEEMGVEAFAAYMQRLGGKLAGQLSGQFAGKNAEERLGQLLAIMADLGFQVQQETDIDSGLPVIKAKNCIYHDVARQHPALCGFDRALMSGLMGQDVQQLSCMAHGDCVCQFRLGAQT